MTNNKLKSRVKYCKAYTGIKVAVNPVTMQRRDPNYVDVSDMNSDAIGDDFFEFEKELSELKAGNKTMAPDISAENRHKK